MNFLESIPAVIAVPIAVLFAIILLVKEFIGVFEKFRNYKKGASSEANSIASLSEEPEKVKHTGIHNQFYEKAEETSCRETPNQSENSSEASLHNLALERGNPQEINDYLWELQQIEGRFVEKQKKEDEFVGTLFTVRITVEEVVRLESGVQIIGFGCHGHLLTIGVPDGLETDAFSLRKGDIIESLATGTMKKIDFMFFYANSIKRVVSLENSSD